LKEIIDEKIDLKNASISIVEDEEAGIPLTVEDLKKDSRFSVRVRSDEDRDVSIISAFSVRNNLTVEPDGADIISKPNVKPKEDITYWIQKLDNPTGKSVGQ
jgi:hypothetical protein